MTVLKEIKATKTKNLKMDDLATLVEQFVFSDYFNKDFSIVNNDFGKTAKRLNDMITVYGDRTNGKFYVRLSKAYSKTAFLFPGASERPQRFRERVNHFLIPFIKIL